MTTPTVSLKQYRFMADRAFAMKNALNELENLATFNLTVDKMREEIRRIGTEVRARLDQIERPKAEADVADLLVGKRSSHQPAF